MKGDFITQPPHPETEWSACRGYSDSPVFIERVLDVPLRDASICTGPDRSYVLFDRNNRWLKLAGMDIR